MKVKGKMGQKNNKLKREKTKKRNGKEIKRLKRVYYFYHPPHSRGFSQRILKQLRLKPNWKIVNDPTKADYIDDVWSNHKLVSKNQTLNRVPYGQLLQNKYTLAQLFKDYWGKYLPETYIFKGKDWITESPLTKNYNKKTIWFLKVPHIDKSYGIYIDKDLNKLVKQAKKLSNSGNGNRKRLRKQRPLIFQPHIKQLALFRGKKFDIRMHVALLYHPDGRFETFLYYNGFIKTSPNKWIYGKLDRDTQLSSITSFLDLYNSKKNKMPFDQALSIIRKHRIPFSEWIYYHQALPKIRAMIIKILMIVL